MKQLERLLLCLISTLPMQQAKACGFYASPSEYRFWIFNPGIVDNLPLSPFYFPHTDGYNNARAVNVHYDENVEQWYQYLKGAADKKAIYEAQYLMDGLLTDKSRKIKTNAFLQVLQQPKYALEWEYFKLAKVAEEEAVKDPWAFRAIMQSQ